MCPKTNCCPSGSSMSANVSSSLIGLRGPPGLPGIVLTLPGKIGPQGIQGDIGPPGVCNCNCKKNDELIQELLKRIENLEKYRCKCKKSEDSEDSEDSE